MIRIGGLFWLCMGALGLGLLVLEGIKRGQKVPRYAYPLAVVLGPIFFFFILPLWVGRWGKQEKLNQKSSADSTR